MKRCGLYIRVSTERQAKVEEGSLKAQNELLNSYSLRFIPVEDIEQEGYGQHRNLFQPKR